jgi:hypothetical protein
MVSILKPMHHQIDPQKEGQPPPPPGPGDGLPKVPAYTLNGIEVDAEFRVNVTGAENGEVDGALVLAVEEQFIAVNLRATDAARAIVAMRGAVEKRRTDEPFDPLSPIEEQFESAMNQPRVAATDIRNRPMPDEVRATTLLNQLQRAAGWWMRNTQLPVDAFAASVNRAGGIPTGHRSDASITQLERAFSHAELLVFSYCDDHHLPRPNTARWRFPGKD